MEPRMRSTPAVPIAMTAAAACLGALLLGGCGTMRAKMTTVVDADMTVSRRVDMVAGGELARRISDESGLGIAYGSVRSGESGFRQYWGNDGFHIEASVLHAAAGDWCRTFTDEMISRDYRWFVTYYHYSAHRDPSSFAHGHADYSPSDDVPPTLYLTEELTMPGTIVASTAEKQLGSTATWSVGLEKLRQGYEVYARSRRINRLETLLSVVLLAAAGVLAALTIAHCRARARG